MVERAVEVVAVDGAHVRVRLLDAACAGCAGCAGRCGLFAPDADGELTLPAPAGGLKPGDPLRLFLDDRRLQVAAWRGYGVAWLGLFAGAAVGHGVGLLMPARADGLTLAGLVSGTLLAVALSKRHRAGPRDPAVAGLRFPSSPHCENPSP